MWIKNNQKQLREESNFKELKCSLNLSEDDNGIIRSYGRIMNANLPYNTRAPIMLSRYHKLAELIVKDCHWNFKHNGEKDTLTDFRANYWITKGKSFVKKILFQCTLCRRYNSRPYGYPKAPNLPELRLRDDKPFSGTGIDYLGPLYSKDVYNSDLEDEEEMHKCYVSLYTCASTRGVILDLVPDYTAKEFINSCIHFISRRGCPQEILSDNGSNVIADSTQNFAANRNIVWHFNVAEAPWYGGFWERLVSSVKRCLKKTVGNTHLSYVELLTVLLEIELILNSRPLVHIYDDNTEEVLTPNHLLFGRKLEAFNNINNTEINSSSCTKRMKYIETVINHFWQRWRSEYLVSLREHSKKFKKGNKLIPQVNDIVHEDKQPPQSWRLGKIVELIPSKDAQIRGAKILIGKSKSIISRPVNKLYPVEYANEFNNDSNVVETLREDSNNDSNVVKTLREDINNDNSNVVKTLREDINNGNSNVVKTLREEYNNVVDVVNYNDELKEDIKIDSVKRKSKREAAMMADLKRRLNNL